MGSCYSNLTNANPILYHQNLQLENLPSDCNNNSIFIIDSSIQRNQNLSELNSIPNISKNTANLPNSVLHSETEKNKSKSTQSASNSNNKIDHHHKTKQSNQSTFVVPILRHKKNIQQSSCDQRRVAISPIHQKCLKNTHQNHKSSSSRSSSLSSATLTPKRSKSPLQEKPKTAPGYQKKLFRRIRDTILLRKNSKQSSNSHQISKSSHLQQNLKFNNDDDDDQFIEIATTTTYNDDQRSNFDSERQTTLIQTYQVSFVPEVSELLEVVLSSSSSDDDDADKIDDYSLNKKKKSKNFLKRFYLTKSGRWKKSKTRDNKVNEKKRKINTSDEHDGTMSRMKPPSTYVHHSSSNNPSSNFHQNFNHQQQFNNHNNDVSDGGNIASSSSSSSSTKPSSFFSHGNKIISSGLVSKKTEQFQQHKLLENNNSYGANDVDRTVETTTINKLMNNDGLKINLTGKNIVADCSQQFKTSKLLPPTQITSSNVASSLFRGLRSRIPSTTSKSTGNVNSQLPPNQQHNSTNVSTKISTLSNNKDKNIANGKSKSSKNSLIKPISAPTLASNEIVSSSSSRSSSSSSLNRGENFSKKSKLPNSQKPIVNNICEPQINQVRKSSSSSNLLASTDFSVYQTGPALPPKPLSAQQKPSTIIDKTSKINKSHTAQAKTLLLSPIRTQQAQIVSVSTNSVVQSKIPETITSREQNSLNNYQPPDVNCIGIPTKPIQSIANHNINNNSNRQQRINFLYGNIVQQPANRSNMSQQSLPLFTLTNNQQSSSIPHQQQSCIRRPLYSTQPCMTNINTVKTSHNVANPVQCHGVGRIKSNFNAHIPKQSEMVGSSAISTTHHYFNPYSRHPPSHSNSNVRNNKFQPSTSINNVPSNNLYRAVPTTITSSNIPQGSSRTAVVNDNNHKNSSSKNFGASKENFRREFPLNHPNLQPPTTNTISMTTLEDFYVSKNNHIARDVPITKKRQVEDNSHEKQIILPADGLDVSEHGTFSCCSSSVSMADDDFDDDLDGLSSGSYSFRTEDLLHRNNNGNKLGVSTSSAQLMSSIISNNDFVKSTLSNITQPLSASICSTASTTSSFVYDCQQSNGHHRAHRNDNHYRARNGSTSTSSCSNRDLFLIDDEIADQPALLIGDAAEIAKQRMNLVLTSNDSVEKDWVMSPTKTLTPSSNSTNANSGSSVELASVSNIEDFPLKETPHQKTSITSSTTSYDSMLQSLNNELENLILQTTKIDNLSQSFDTTEIISDSNSVSDEKILTSQNNDTSQNTKRLASSKLRKRHSYTSSNTTNTQNNLHKVPVFRRPRPLSFVENQDGSYGLDSPSLRAVAQDLIGIKTLLFRLQNVLQNSETQNPFENANNHRYSYDSTSTKSSTPVSTTTPGSHHTDHSFDETVQLLREENFDLRQHCQLLEQKLVEKDHTIRLLQQQMSKYTMTNFSNHRQIITADRKSGFQLSEDLHNNNMHPGENLQQLSNSTTNNFPQKSLINSTTQTEPLFANLINRENIGKTCKFRNDNNKDGGDNNNHATSGQWISFWINTYA
ncbi:uncharacterized protein LOC124494615 isoform X2 [Dermatophagoides farinae]|uniref:uncharacterized protein LOC124494615 isoform X2 n=1 Tax=Dermatophagoides farinae TaxID=6954 RepID=UPI003F5F06FE